MILVMTYPVREVMKQDAKVVKVVTVEEMVVQVEMMAQEAQRQAQGHLRALRMLRMLKLLSAVLSAYLKGHLLNPEMSWSLSYLVLCKLSWDMSVYH